MFDPSLKHSILVSAGALRHALMVSGAFLLGFCPEATAGDSKLVLNKLVKKGLLTPAEAEEIIAEEAAETAGKPQPVAVRTKETETTRFTIAGKVQTQFKFIQSIDRTGTSQEAQSQGFELRRMDINIEGRIGDAFRGVVDYRAETNPPNFGTTVVPDAGFQVDKAFIEYDSRDYGLLLFGMRKATFGHEEYQSSSYLPSIERGIVNNYFSGNLASPFNLGLGERRMGLYHDTADTAKIEKNGGTKAGLAITNDIRRRFDKDSNRYAYYVNALHVEKLGENTFLDFGVNGTYTDTKANRKIPVGIHHSGAVEAYFRFRHDNFTAILDGYQGILENGRAGPGGGYQQALPAGVMLMGAYLISGAFEPVVSFNWLDTDGRGVAAGDVIRNARTYTPADHAMQLYTGANWYLTKSKSLKISAGLELARFEGATQGSAQPVETDVIGGRVQVQALF